MEGPEEYVHVVAKSPEKNPRKKGFWGWLTGPVDWLRMLCEELHWSVVLGVVIVYEISQGQGVGQSRISTQYYKKDEQKMQPSEAQVYFGIIQIPWVVKPLWGLFADTIPILGYRR